MAGAEEIIYSAAEMMRMEKANRRKLGVLADLPVYGIPYSQVKKIAALKNYIFGGVRRNKKVIIMEKTLILKHIL